MPDIAYLGPQDYTEDSLVERLKNESPTILSVDTETISLKDRAIIGLGIGLNQREAVYFPIWPDPSKYLSLAWKLLASPATKVFHNALYDLYALTEYLADSESSREAYQPRLRSGDWLEVVKQHKKRNCRFCGTTKELVLHHIDGNPWDDTPSNLLTACSRCHDKLHTDLVGTWRTPLDIAWRGASVQTARLTDFLGHARLADTSAMAHVQALPNNALAEMARAYIGMKIDSVQDILPARKTMLDLPMEDVAFKCMRDCLATLRLYYKMGGDQWWSPDSHTWTYEPNWYEGCDPLEPTSYAVTPGMKDCYQVDMKLIPLLMRMSRRGIALRPELVKDWYIRTSESKLFFEDICNQEGFNPASPQQVGYTLAARGSFLPFTKSKKQLATDEETLSSLTDPMATVVLKHREYAKLKSTYLEPWLGEDRATTHFRIDLSTARLASYDRNLQNIPPGIREIFAPDSGTWSDADFDQIELRIFAYITKDPVMLEAYRLGLDLHAITQGFLWPGSDLEDKQIRVRAKVFNFAGGIYGGDPKVVSASTKLPFEVCKSYIEVWRAKYPVGAAWIEAQKEGPWDYIENVFGRRCRLPAEVYHTPAHIYKCRLNYPPQSSAAEVVKRAMLLCERLGMDEALQVHDEILADGDVEFPDSLAHIHSGIHTPFKVVKGSNWL
mgnify:CR=1 FL=1